MEDLAFFETYHIKIIMLWNIICLLICFSVAHSAVANCTFSPVSGVTFDLSALSNDTQDYYIFNRLSSIQNQTYVINFCRDVVSIPEYIEDGKNLCEETVKDMQDENKIMTKEKVPAFVISRYEKECHRLSSPFVGTNHYFYQYDYSDPTAGVVISYYNGDYFNMWYHYSIEIYLRCSDNPIIPAEADVYQYTYGFYQLWLDSVYACPQECYPKDGKICSGHGICMKDDSIDASRCFCNSNSRGEDCSKGLGLSMTEIFMIVDIAAVVIIVFTIIYLGCKLRKIRLDPEANVSLDTKYNELGSIAYTL